MTDVQVLRTRVEALEKRLQHARLAAGLLIILGLGSVVAMKDGARAQARAEVIRVRAVVIVDEDGRDRVVIGAPVPDPKEGKRRSSSTGIVINDPDGHERFGLGVKADGSVSMGFDAPAGVGDPRNRERLTMAVNSSGLAELRVLDNRTRMQARLSTSKAGPAHLQFLDWSEKGLDSTLDFGVTELKRLAQAR